MFKFNSSYLLFLRVSVVRLDHPDPLDSLDPLYVTSSKQVHTLLNKRNKICFFFLNLFL